MTGLRRVVANGNGAFALSNVVPGLVTVTATLAGFRSAQSSFNADERPRRLEIAMPVSSSVEETLAVTAAESPRVDLQRSAVAPPSQNVVDLQRKATGVLPVRVDVPRAGTSHQFVKPLVVDQETVVRLRYNRR